MIAPLKLATTAVAAILSTATIHNTVETFFTINNSLKGRDASIIGSSNSVLAQYLPHRNLTDDKNEVCEVPLGKTKDEIIKDFKSMSRKELVTLFQYCKVPDDLGVIEGDWDGLLLNNNLVLTSVTGFITNVLFGKNTPWKGKAFGAVSANDSLDQKRRVGINRFMEQTSIRKTHKFDYSIESSFFGRSSIRLNYSPYQGNLSLWKTMVDEVRVVEVPNRSEGEDHRDIILLGMGSMGWSGGMYNSSPFCLYKSSKSESKHDEAVEQKQNIPNVLIDVQ